MLDQLYAAAAANDAEHHAGAAAPDCCRTTSRRLTRRRRPASARHTRTGSDADRSLAGGRGRRVSPSCPGAAARRTAPVGPALTWDGISAAHGGGHREAARVSFDLRRLRSVTRGACHDGRAPCCKRLRLRLRPAGPRGDEAPASSRRPLPPRTAGPAGEPVLSHRFAARRTRCSTIRRCGGPAGAAGYRCTSLRSDGSGHRSWSGPAA